MTHTPSRNTQALLKFTRVALLGAAVFAGQTYAKGVITTPNAPAPTLSTSSVLSKGCQALAKKKGAMPAANKKCDPFSGHVWHAIEGGWPGTIKFTADGSKVVLAPMGAEEIRAKYSYTVGVGADGSLLGSLTMATEGQVSKASYRILESGRRLVLDYEGGMRPEAYLRMTVEEEAKEMERIRTQLNDPNFKWPTPAKP